MVKHKEHHQYLKSKHWKTRREQIKNKMGDKFICSRCFSDRNICLHHRTYKRLYSEKKSDIVLLCRDCHNEVHQLVKEGKARLYDCHLSNLTPDNPPFTELDLEYLFLMKLMLPPKQPISPNPTDNNQKILKIPLDNSTV